MLPFVGPRRLPRLPALFFATCLTFTPRSLFSNRLFFVFLPAAALMDYGASMVKRIAVHTNGQGMREITGLVQKVVAESGISEGICNIFIQHTSASLTIQENADDSARRDLESWLNRLVPEGQTQFTHVLEGADDMPSHIKSALTAVCLAVPVSAGRLALGAWQGIFLWEHRRAAHSRTLVVHVGE